MTTDGGGGLQDPYDLVALLEDHVEVVDHEAIADFALQHHRARPPLQLKTDEDQLCPSMNRSGAQRTTCPAGWRCALKDNGPTGACHFEYPPAVLPHRENCYGCRNSAAKNPLACE